MIGFSIIIPLYNKAESIYSTVDSVLSQYYNNFELIIINDGSTDNSLEKVKQFDDSRIRIINKSNGGVSSARNMGIMEARYDYVVFLDADDLWLPYCLQEFICLINEFPVVDIFCTNFNMSGRNLKGSPKRYFIDDYYYATAFYLARWSIRLMVTGCVAVRKTLFDRAGYFNESLTHGEDIDMWERLTAFSGIAKSERITTIYRIDAEHRASLVEDSLKRKEDPLYKIKNIKATSSLKLYYGVQFIFDIRTLFLNKDVIRLVRDYSKYFHWIVCGLFFIVKIRIFKLRISSLKRF